MLHSKNLLKKSLRILQSLGDLLSRFSCDLIQNHVCHIASLSIDCITVPDGERLPDAVNDLRDKLGTEYRTDPRIKMMGGCRLRVCHCFNEFGFRRHRRRGRRGKRIRTAS